MIFRRNFLCLLVGGMFSRLRGEAGSGAAPCTPCTCKEAARTEVERLLDENPAFSPVSTCIAACSASATVVLFSIPVVPRAHVGSGYTVLEEGVCRAGRASRFSSARGRGQK